MVIEIPTCSIDHAERILGKTLLLIPANLSGFQQIIKGIFAFRELGFQRSRFADFVACSEQQEPCEQAEYFANTIQEGMDAQEVVDDCRTNQQLAFADCAIIRITNVPYNLGRLVGYQGREQGKLLASLIGGFDIILYIFESTIEAGNRVAHPKLVQQQNIVRCQQDILKVS